MHPITQAKNPKFKNLLNFDKTIAIWIKINSLLAGKDYKESDGIEGKIHLETVAQAIPTYSMSVFKLPKSICDNINSLLAKYWWGQNHDERKIHWINWKNLCTSKEEGMGFRDLHAFNLAMLAKQAWQLVKDNRSLFYRVYKARYFPHCSFMEAELGNNPSFVWRSLLAAREIIKEGSRWKVGNGRKIGVFTHRWLSHSPVPLNEPLLNMRVCDLIDQDTRQWDRGKIHSTFAHRTCTEILSMPLDNLNSGDSVIWKENRAQQFTVKTAYQVALRLQDHPRAEHSAARTHGTTWKEIWTLNVPPKVRNFMWRACSNCLPTRDNLHRRHVKLEPTCELCRQHPETVSHLLWTCPFARNVWALFKGKTQKCSNEPCDFFLLSKQMQSKLSKIELERWAVTAWAIWNARNKYYFEKI